MAKRQRKNQAKRTKTKAGYWVQSHSEAKIDNWLFKQKVNYVYEPVFWLDEKRIVPDWVILPTPELGIEQSIIIEYWGLDYSPSQMKQVSGWVKDAAPKYQKRKKMKGRNRKMKWNEFGADDPKNDPHIGYPSDNFTHLADTPETRKWKE